MATGSGISTCIQEQSDQYCAEGKIFIYVFKLIYQYNITGQLLLLLNVKVNLISSFFLLTELLLQIITFPECIGRNEDV